MVPLGLLGVTALLLILPPSALVQGRHHELNNGAAIGSHQLSAAAGVGLSSQSAQSGSLASGVMSSVPAAGASSSSSSSLLSSSAEDDVARITLSKDAGRLDGVRNRTIILT